MVARLVVPHLVRVARDHTPRLGWILHRRTMTHGNQQR